MNGVIHGSPLFAPASQRRWRFTSLSYKRRASIGRRCPGTAPARSPREWSRVPFSATGLAVSPHLPHPPMPDDIPFDKTFDLAPETVEEVAPGLRRILANNPGPFTFKGTVTYIVGRGEVAVIDPGPDDACHLAAIRDAVRGETVTHILVTHTH